MTATVYHYRDYEKATQAWSNMERVRLVEQMLAETKPAPYVPVEWQAIDTAPSEYCAPESDSA